MASLYKDLVRAGIPTDHHESDLYVLDTPEARETLKKYGYKFTTFTSNLDGKRWIDVPFAYEPFWEKKGKRTAGAATRKPAHARKRSAWPSVVGSHSLGTADVRTANGAYWIVTVPTGYRVDYKPWGPSNELDLGTFSSRQRAQAKISEHSGGVGGAHAKKSRAHHATMKGPHVLKVSSGKTFAGQRSITAEVQYPGESPSRVEFVGPSASIGGAGPVVMISRGNQTFVTDPSRFGNFGTAWVRRFFENA